MDDPATPDADATDAPGAPTAPTVAEPAAAGRAAGLERDPRYEVVGELGRGGMGRVVRVRDRRLGRDVAIKELTGHGPRGRARFERETRITARLQHPAIVPVYDASAPGDAAPYYAMKVVDGETLAARIARTTGMPDRLALLRHVVTVAEAIAYAHGQQIIHRDLKAANVVVGELGETFVIDWGLAKELGEPGEDAPSAGPFRGTGDGALTEAGDVMGTPAYMSPEQAEGDPVDARTDVYALGVMLYHLLTGALPYDGKSSREILARVLDGPPPPLLDRAPEAPRDLAAIVAKAMARAPADRYPSARELARELTRFQAGQLVLTHRYGALERIARWVRRHRAVVGVAAAALVIAAGLGGLAIASIIDARATAEAARGDAERARDRAEQARQDATARADDAILATARERLARDPRAALDTLTGLSPGSPRWAEAGSLTADALADGVRTPLGTLVGPRAIAIAGDGAVVAASATAHLLARDHHASISAAPAAAVARDGSAIAWLEGAAIAVRVANLQSYLPAPPDAVELAVASAGRAVAVIDRGGGVWLINGAGAPARALGTIAMNPTATRMPGDLGRVLAFAEDESIIVAMAWPVGGAAWQRDGTRVTPEGCSGIAASADGRWLTFKHDATLVLRDRQSGRDRVLEDTSGWRELRFDPRGRWLAATSPSSAEIELWDLTSDQHLALTGHGSIVRAIAFGDGLLASTGDDATARVWDLARVAQLGAAFEPGGASGVARTMALGSRGRAIAIADDGSVITASEAGEIARWPRPRYRIEWTAGGPMMRSPGDAWVAHVDDSAIRLEPTGGATARVIDGYAASWRIQYGGPRGQARVVASSPMPAFAAAAPIVVIARADGLVRVRLDAPDAPAAPIATPPGVTEVEVSADGRTVAARDRDAALYLLREGQAPVPIGDPGASAIFGFTPDGAYLWQRGEPGLTRVADVAPVAQVAGTPLGVSPDGRLAIASAEALRLCRPEHTCQALADSADLVGIAFGPGGRIVGARGDGTVLFWPAPDQRPRRLGRTQGGFREARFAPDQRRVVTIGDGPEVVLWDLDRGTHRVLRSEMSRPREPRFVGAEIELLDDFARVWLPDDVPADEAGIRARIGAALAP